jgi:hypothetical protein
MNELGRCVGLFLLAAISSAAAGPSIPSTALPGRERERFASPLDRYFEPGSARSKPLLRWDCRPAKPSRSAQKKTKRATQC